MSSGYITQEEYEYLDTVGYTPAVVKWLLDKGNQRKAESEKGVTTPPTKEEVVTPPTQEVTAPTITPTEVPPSTIPIETITTAPEVPTPPITPPFETVETPTLAEVPTTIPGVTTTPVEQPPTTTGKVKYNIGDIVEVPNIGTVTITNIDDPSSLRVKNEYGNELDVGRDVVKPIKVGGKDVVGIKGVVQETTGVAPTTTEEVTPKEVPITEIQPAPIGVAPPTLPPSVPSPVTQLVQPVKQQEVLRNRVMTEQEFRDRSPGHTRFVSYLNNMVAKDVISPEGKLLLLEIFKDTRAESLGSITTQVTPRLGPAGEATNKERYMAIRKAKGSEVGDIIFTGEIVFLHEYAHFEYYLLSKEEIDIVKSVYSKLGESGRYDFFKQTMEDATAKVYSKTNKSEFFAESFALYVYKNKTPDKVLKPLFERLIGKLKDGMLAVKNHLFPDEMKRLEPLFEKVLAGIKPEMYQNVETTPDEVKHLVGNKNKKNETFLGITYDKNIGHDIQWRVHFIKRTKLWSNGFKTIEDAILHVKESFTKEPMGKVERVTTKPSTIVTAETGEQKQPKMLPEGEEPTKKLLPYELSLNIGDIVNTKSYGLLKVTGVGSMKIGDMEIPTVTIMYENGIVTIGKGPLEQIIIREGGRVSTEGGEIKLYTKKAPQPSAVKSVELEDIIRKESSKGASIEELSSKYDIPTIFIERILSSPGKRLPKLPDRMDYTDIFEDSVNIFDKTKDELSGEEGNISLDTITPSGNAINVLARGLEISEKAVRRLVDKFELPETIEDKYISKHSDVSNIVTSTRYWSRLIGEGNWTKIRLLEKLGKFSREEQEAGLRAYEESNYENEESKSYNKLSKNGKIVFNLLNSNMMKIRDDIVSTRKAALIEQVLLDKKLNNDTKNEYIKAINNLVPSKLEEGSTLQTRLQLIADIGKRNYFIPESRRGRWMVSIINPSTNESIFSVDFKSEYEANNFKNAIYKRDYSVISDWFKTINKPVPADVRLSLRGDKTLTTIISLEKVPKKAVRDISLVKSYQLIKSIAGKQDVDVSAFNDALEYDLRDFLYQTGWTEHLLRKRGVPGSKLDYDSVMDRISDYIIGYYSSKGKMYASSEMYKSIGNIVGNNKIEPQLIKRMQGYIDYTLGNPEVLMNKVAGVVSKLYLAYKISSIVVNSTQNFQSGIASYIHNGVNIGEMFTAWKDLFVSSGPFKKAGISTDKLSWNDKKAVLTLLKSGEGQAMVMKEIVEREGGILGAGMIPFQLVEVYINRIPNFLGAFRDGMKKSNSNFDYSYKRALKVMEESHYWASRFNRPEVMRKTGRPLTALQTFQFHYFKQLGYYLRHDDYLAFAYLALIGTLLGGSKALLGGGISYWVLKKAYRFVTGNDLNTAIENIKPKAIKKFVKEGLLGLIGLGALSPSIGVGFSEDPQRNLVILTAYEQAKKSLRFINEFNVNSALNAVPFSVVNNMYKAVSGYFGEGLRTSYGSPIVDSTGKRVRYTPGEAITRLIGFSTEKERDIYRQDEILRRAADEKSKDLVRFRNRIIGATADEDKLKITTEIIERNVKIRNKIQSTDNMLEKHRLALTYINMDDLERSIASHTRAYETGIGGVKTRPFRQIFEESNR